MKIKALVETIGDFTLEQLKLLQSTGAILPITLNFDHKNPIGIVDKIELVDDKKLIVYGTITKESAKDNLDELYLTIGYITEHYKMVCYGTTYKPLNKDLTKIQILEY